MIIILFFAGYLITIIGTITAWQWKFSGQEFVLDDFLDWLSPYMIFVVVWPVGWLAIIGYALMFTFLKVCGKLMSLYLSLVKKAAKWYKYET